MKPDPYLLDPYLPKAFFPKLLVVFLMCQLLTSCDPADIREITFSVPRGEKEMLKLINEINPIVLRHGFRPDRSNGTLIHSTEGDLLAAWRRKLNPEDQATRIACFVFFNRQTNSGRVKLILFPGEKLPPDMISMFEELKTRVNNTHILITPLNSAN